MGPPDKGGKKISLDIPRLGNIAESEGKGKRGGLFVPVDIPEKELSDRGKKSQRGGHGGCPALREGRKFFSGEC